MLVLVVEIDCLNHEAMFGGYLLGMYGVLLGIGLTGTPSLCFAGNDEID